MRPPRWSRARVVVALGSVLLLGAAAAACGAVGGSGTPTPDTGGGDPADTGTADAGTADGSAGEADGGPDAADARGDTQPAADGAGPVEDGGGDRDGSAADAGPCPLGAADPACDDGDPCTADACHAALGGCVHAPLTGPSCAGPAGCGGGVCQDGRCVDFTACDDGYLCTLDLCQDGGACAWEETATLGRPAAEFELVDTNPYSPTYGETFSLARLEGQIVVLTFMASGCEPCCLQGEAARPLVDALRAQPDVFLAAVDTRSVLLGGSPESIETCVTTDADGAPPLTSQWPYLRDNDAWQVWNRYCAENYRTVVIDADRQITYYRNVNFEDPPFHRELLEAIDSARSSVASVE